MPLEHHRYTPERSGVIVVMSPKESALMNNLRDDSRGRQPAPLFLGRMPSNPPFEIVNAGDTFTEAALQERLKTLNRYSPGFHNAGCAERIESSEVVDVVC
jgi:hypothetical protein